MLGPRLGKQVQAVIGAAKAGNWSTNPDGTVTVGEHRLQPGEFTLALDPKEGVAAAPLPGNQAVIVLDTEVTPELEAEGFARDLVRAIQQARKDADLHVSDRIHVALHAPEVITALGPHLDWIARSVLATELTESDRAGDVDTTVGDHPVSFSVSPAA